MLSVGICSCFEIPDWRKELNGKVDTGGHVLDMTSKYTAMEDLQTCGTARGPRICHEQVMMTSLDAFWQKSCIQWLQEMRCVDSCRRRVGDMPRDRQCHVSGLPHKGRV